MSLPFSHSSTNPHDSQQLDRLVDGELPQAERQALLARLDQVPDGWRRLALSFLEAQCWRETAGAIRGEAQPAELVALPTSETAASGATQPPNPRKHEPWKPWMTAPLAMAASFLIAFALGVVLRDAWSGRSGPAPQIASQDSADRFAKALAAHHSKSAAKSPLNAQIREADLDALERESAFDAAGGDNATEVWLPVDLASSDEALDANAQPAVPQRVLDSLKRLGHEVETHRSLWPVDLKNGQRALVPVDEVEIRYVGHEYQ